MDPQFEKYLALLELVQKNPTKAALRKAMAAVGLSFDLNEPISGYFRLRRADGAIDPVSIWRDGDDLYILWGHDEARLEAVWPRCAWHPVPYEWAEAKLERGQEWPDVHQFVDDDDLPPLDGIEELVGRLPARDAVPGPGHNSGATVDEVRLLADRIDEAKRGVRQYASITSDEQRARSQDLRSELLKLSGDADKKRKALTRPHEEAINAINGKWMPLVKSAKAGADAIRQAQEAWGTLKLRRQREEQERIEAERRRLEEEAAAEAEAAEAAVEQGEAPPQPTYRAPPTVPERTAPQTSFKGGHGRAAHERAVEVIDEADVSDWSALFLYFVDNSEARKFILKMANSVLKSHSEVAPGCKTSTVAKVA